MLRRLSCFMNLWSLTSKPHRFTGFRKQHSCLTQLLEHIDNVLKNLSNGNEVDVIYLDYSKAFDKVDHAVLLAKMQQYGITGKVLDWVESFLSNRQQIVVVEGCKSLPAAQMSKVESLKEQCWDRFCLSST